MSNLSIHIKLSSTKYILFVLNQQWNRFYRWGMKSKSIFWRFISRRTPSLLVHGELLRCLSTSTRGGKTSRQSRFSLLIMQPGDPRYQCPSYDFDLYFSSFFHIYWCTQSAYRRSRSPTLRYFERLVCESVVPSSFLAYRFILLTANQFIITRDQKTLWKKNFT